MATRVHKSFIVALKAIKLVEGNQIFLAQKVIPIGRFYREALLKKLL
ncbi:hypothetical protein [Desertivirga brevis]